MKRWMTYLSVSALACLLVAGCDQKPAEQANATPATEKQGAAISADGSDAKKNDDVAKADDAKKADEAPKDAPEAEAAKVGQPAPEFALTDQDGKEHKLSEYKGKIVVLEWTNPTCPYVVRHYKKKTMVTTHEKLGQEVVWMAIDSTKTVQADALKEWRTTHGFKHNILLDPSGTTGKLYGAKTTPHMFVIDDKGVLRYSGAIDDDKSDDKENDVNYVLDAVNAVKDGKDVGKPETTPYGCSVKYAS